MRKRNKKEVSLKNRNEFLEYLHGLFLVTGRSDMLFCNAFLDEAVQLLANAVFLYEDGMFDCAFYSIRQAGEMVDNMLYISMEGSDALERWLKKEYFPMDSKLKSKLEKMSEDYKEIKQAIPDFFEQYDEIIRKAHKIIHKQGFDTFYTLRASMPEKYGSSEDEEMNLFVEGLKYAIAKVLIIYILLDPLSLALTDKEVSPKIHFDPMTEPVDVSYFSNYLHLDSLIEKIRETRFYQDYVSFFANQETMLPAVYSVIRENAWNINELSEIHRQLDLLNSYERFMFSVLMSGIRVSSFYMYNGLSWYLTSIPSNFSRNRFGSEEFDKYLNAEFRFNQQCEGVFMSVVMMYGEPLYIEHNEPLLTKEILFLKMLEHQSELEGSDLGAG